MKRMSKLAQLQGKVRTFNIGGVDLELTPLSMDDLDLISVDKDAPEDKQMEMIKKIIFKVLKQSVPDSTDEEIKKISLEHMNDFSDAMTELHNMKQSAKLDKLKDAIAKRQTQRTQEESK